MWINGSLKTAKETLFQTATPQFPQCRRMLELNPGLFQRLHFQSDVLLATGLDLVHTYSRSHMTIDRPIQMVLHPFYSKFPNIQRNFLRFFLFKCIFVAKSLTARWCDFKKVLLYIIHTAVRLLVTNTTTTLH
jgi:hypothetical protein